MQVDDGAAAIEVPNSHEVVSSRTQFFVLESCARPEDVIPSQDNGATRIHVPRCKVKEPNFIQMAQSKTIPIFTRCSILPSVS